MKSVVCNICKSSQAHPVFLLKDVLHGLPGEFQLVRCAACGFLYLNPQPEWAELAAHYPQDYAPHQVASQAGGLVASIQQAGIGRRVKLVRQWAAGGRLLDVGSGTGQFLAAMRQSGGWDCQGVDPVPAAAETSRRVAGVPVFCGTLAEAHFESGIFDVVTLWYVLEHVPAPLEDLQEIQRILKPGGLVVICTPNADAPAARLFGSCWASYNSPRHLGVFPLRLLEGTLENLGFARRGVRYLSSEFFDFFASLAICFNMSGHPRAEAACRWAMQSSILRLLTFWLFILPALLGQASNPVFIARKGAQKG